MKKVITGIFAGALSVVVLTWAFDAMGRVGHEGAGHHGAGTDSAEHAEAGPADGVSDDFDITMRYIIDEVLVEAEAGPADGVSDDSDADFDDRRGARMNLPRRAMDRLELTDDQQEQIKTLRSAYSRDMVQLRADTRLARIELRELMNETSPDVSRVKELAAAVSRSQGSVFELGAVFRAEFKNVLTEKQQETLRESFRDRRDGRRDSGMRWRRGGRESRNRR